MAFSSTLFSISLFFWNIVCTYKNYICIIYKFYKLFQCFAFILMKITWTKLVHWLYQFSVHPISKSTVADTRWFIYSRRVSEVAATGCASSCPLVAVSIHSFYWSLHWTVNTFDDAWKHSRRFMKISAFELVWFRNVRTLQVNNNLI